MENEWEGEVFGADPLGYKTASSIAGVNNEEEDVQVVKGTDAPPINNGNGL